MAHTKTIIVSTRLDKDSDAQRTELTIDFSQLTPTDIEEYACMTLVVKWQGNIRRKGHIPAKATYVVPKPGTRMVKTAEEQIAEMTLEQKKALIAKIQADINKK